MVKQIAAEQKAWTLTTTIMAGMGALILAMLGAGFWSLNAKIEAGDIAINLRLTEMSGQIQSTSNQFNQLCRDVSRIDAYQKVRLNRESKENQGK